MRSPVQTILLQSPIAMASGLPLSSDILGSANQVAQRLGLVQPFVIRSMSPDRVLSEQPCADLVILPGLGLATPAELDEALTTTLSPLVRALQALRSPQTTFATSCSGVFAFGQAGLIDNKRVTTTWWLSAHLQALFPTVDLANGELVVQDDTVVTAGAALAHIDLLFSLIERFAGAAITDSCRRFLIVDDRRSQLPYVSTATLIAADPQLRKAEAFVHKHIHEPIGVSGMAMAAGLGTRTFSRRLKSVAAMTPTQFLQSIRVSRAIKLAKETQLVSDEIADRVGYSDASSLRRVVKKQTGKTLEAFRDFVCPTPVGGRDPIPKAGEQGSPRPSGSAC